MHPAPRVDHLGGPLGLLPVAEHHAVATGAELARLPALPGEQKAERQKLANLQAARSGKPYTAGIRPFGYADDHVTVLPKEAEAIREGAAMILAGESLSAVARRWTEAGRLSPRGIAAGGKAWTLRGVKQVLTSPRYIGQVTYRGEVMGDGQWSAILNNPERFSGGKRTGRTPQTLLTGIGLCGVCGETGSGHGYRGVPVYGCVDTHTQRGVRDGHVRGEVLFHLLGTHLDFPLGEARELACLVRRAEREEVHQGAGVAGGVEAGVDADREDHGGHLAGDACDGGTPITYTGVKVPQAIERTHLNQGWAGVGYNFVIDQGGTIYEGRGWTMQGAHCPDHNVSGIGVQIAIGGDQEPSAKALSAARTLYDEACAKTGRTLAKKGHKDGFATACPGPKLYAWVQAGMPADGYVAAPNPGGDAGVARYQVTINGLKYGYDAYGNHVTKVGKALVAKGFGKHYTEGRGPRWTDADTLNYADFQRSIGHSGSDADGVPGESSLKQLLGTLPGAAAVVRYEPFPGATFFKNKPKSAIVTAMGKRLVAEGCSAYSSGPGPQWTEADRLSYAKWQRKLGYSGVDADGYPGKSSWDKLRVPEV